MHLYGEGYPPTATPPGRPYSLDVALINGRYYFVGWLPNANNTAMQGIWLVSSSTPDGSARGDFTKWVPFVYDANGTSWHSADAASLAFHVAGLEAPTLLNENGVYWLYYSGVQRDPDGLWTSLGRTQVNSTALAVAWPLLAARRIRLPCSPKDLFGIDSSLAFGTTALLSLAT